jgi:hypothetical protein
VPRLFEEGLLAEAAFDRRSSQNGHESLLALTDMMVLG